MEISPSPMTFNNNFYNNNIIYIYNIYIYISRPNSALNARGLADPNVRLISISGRMCNRYLEFSVPQNSSKSFPPNILSLNRLSFKRYLYMPREHPKEIAKRQKKRYLHLFSCSGQNPWSRLSLALVIHTPHQCCQVYLQNISRITTFTATPPSAYTICDDASCIIYKTFQIFSLFPLLTSSGLFSVRQPVIIHEK